MADPGFHLHDVELELEGSAVNMAHVRTQIRGAVVAAVTGLPTSGANVFDSRPEGREWNENDLPGLNVLTPTDALVLENEVLEDPETREVGLVVECRAKSLDSASVADQCSAEVQAALDGAGSLGGLIRRQYLASSETSLSGELDLPIAVVRLNFVVWYRIAASDPETAVS